MQCEMRYGDAPWGCAMRGGVSGSPEGNVAKKGKARPCVGSGEIMGEGKSCQGDGSVSRKKECDPVRM